MTYPLRSRLATDFSEGTLSSIVVIPVVGLLAGVVEKAADLPTGRMPLFPSSEQERKFNEILKFVRATFQGIFVKKNLGSSFRRKIWQ